MRRFWRSAQLAWSGIAAAWREERHMKIHTVLSIVAVALAFACEFNRYEWIVLLLLIASVMALEIVNSAIERVVNLVTSDFHPLAKQAKDMAAGAVLFFVIVAIVIAVLLYGPHFTSLYEKIS